jgi:hypothetical protein
MGAEGVRALLRAIDLKQRIDDSAQGPEGTSSDAKIKKLAKRPEGARKASRTPTSSRLDGDGSAAGAAAGAAPLVLAGRRRFATPT